MTLLHVIKDWKSLFSPFNKGPLESNIIVINNIRGVGCFFVRCGSSQNIQYVYKKKKKNYAREWKKSRMRCLWVRIALSRFRCLFGRMRQLQCGCGYKTVYLSCRLTYFLSLFGMDLNGNFVSGVFSLLNFSRSNSFRHRRSQPKRVMTHSTDKKSTEYRFCFQLESSILPKWFQIQRARVEHFRNRFINCSCRWLHSINIGWVCVRVVFFRWKIIYAFWVVAHVYLFYRFRRSNKSECFEEEKKRTENNCICCTGRSINSDGKERARK